MDILETKRCILRPITLDDADYLFEYYSQEEVVKYLPFKPHNNISDTKNFIKIFFLNNYDKDKVGHFAIVHKKDNKVIGNVGFNSISKNSRKGEIGICINPSYWGKNLSTELATEMLRYGFDNLKLNKIIATTFDDNKYSRRSLEELGFEYLGIYKKKYKILNKTIICNKYEMTINSYNKNYKTIKG